MVPPETENKKIYRRPTLADAISRLLRKDIDTQVYKSGERLPTESLLCETYGVSRPVIREAVSQLKNDNLVVSRQGSGVFVSENPAGYQFRLDSPDMGDKEEVFKILEILLAVEVYATGMAAQNRTNNQLNKIKATFDDLKLSVQEGQLGSKEDLAFHTEIVNATNNQYFIEFWRFLKKNARYAIIIARKNTSRFSDLRKDVLKEHEDILTFITDRNPENAKKAAETHLKNAVSRLKLT
jgi:GntR family transcriptional repressor for pyruvate dehydrogenase complex